MQVIVCSFIADGGKDSKAANQTEPLSAPSRLHSGIGAVDPISALSRGTQNESLGGRGNTLNQTTAAINSTPPSMSDLPWN